MEALNITITCRFNLLTPDRVWHESRMLFPWDMYPRQLVQSPFMARKLRTSLQNKFKLALRNVLVSVKN